MLEISCTIPIPNTPQELEKTLQHYRESDIDGLELFCEWQAICEASLNKSSLSLIVTAFLAKTATKLSFRVKL